MRRLERDHERAGALHESIDRLGRRWLIAGCLSEQDVDELKQHLARLNIIYQAHIAAEDHELFPAAARLLDAAEIQAIGREMAARHSRNHEGTKTYEDHEDFSSHQEKRRSSCSS